jgi:hypothetical protein
MTDKLADPELLRQNVGRLKSRVGGCFLGSHVMFRDKNLHTELAEHRSLAGYGRPISNHRDERLDPILKLARELGLGDGPHVRVAHEVERFLLDSRLRMTMNYAAIAAALTADMGLSAREHYLYVFLAFFAGMAPCYLDAVARPANTVLPLPCSAVGYAGAAKRNWKKL